PGQTDLADADDVRVVLGDLLLDAIEILVGEPRSIRVESEARPDRLRRGGRRGERLRVGLGVAADGDGAPDIVGQRQPERLPQIRECGIVQMTVAVDDHVAPVQVPATTIRLIRRVGDTVRSRRTRSSPTPSIAASMPRRFPATVTSSTGYASSPFSIQSPTAPRE